MGHWGAQGHNGTQWDTGDTEIMPFRFIFVLFTLRLYNSRSMNALVFAALAEVQVAVQGAAVICLSNTLRFANVQYVNRTEDE